MPYQSLRDLYVDELRDLYDAERQIERAMPKMIKSASSPDLRNALQNHYDETKFQVERLDLIFKRLEQTPEGVRCKGIEGVINEGMDRLQQGGAPDVSDAALIASAQRIEHYEMAAYGCARTFADRLNDGYASDLLQKTLDEEGAADKRLTDLAEGGINQTASAGKSLGGPRLSYVSKNQLSANEGRFDDVKVIGAGNQDLGKVDGFVVERESGRPYYVVVDSGGWFAGDRYLLPIGSGRLDVRARQLKLETDKDTIKKYPKFDRDGFVDTGERGRDYEAQLLRTFGGQSIRQTSAGEWDYDAVPEFRQPEWWITEGVSVRPLPPDTRRRAEQARLESERIAARDRRDREFRDETARSSSEGRSTIDEPTFGTRDTERDIDPSRRNRNR